MAGKKECFLITGASGLIGSWILRQLTDEGVRCVAFDLQPNDTILQQVLTPDAMKRVEFQYGDVADPATMKKLVETVRPTAILHLAGLQIPTCQANPMLGARVNILGTLNVFEAVRNLSIVTGEDPVPIVYASSAGVLGPASDYEGSIPIADHRHHVPRTHYGYFKLCNEGNASVFWSLHKIPSVGLRPLTVYGVGREVGMTSGPTKAIKAILDRRPGYTIPFTGPTGFSYVKDLATIFAACAREVQQRKGAEVFNIRGDVMDVTQFVTAIEEVLPEGRGRIKIEGPVLPIACETDESNLKAFLGPRMKLTPLVPALREVIALYKDNQKRGVWHTRDLDPVPPPAKL